MRSQSDSQTPRPILPIYFLGLRVGALTIIFPVLMFVAYIYFRLSLIVFYPILLIGVLGILTLSNYANLHKVFIDQGVAQSVPAKFASKMAELEENANQMRQLGFEELDRQYIRRNVDCLFIILRHQQRPIYWRLAQYPLFTYSTLSTLFENGSFLTTKSINNVNHPVKNLDHRGIYVQCLENAKPSQLLEAHQDALEILMQYGYIPLPCFTEPDDLRQLMVEIERQVIRQVMIIPFWPLRMSFWIWFKVGRKYNVPLREQIANNTTKIVPVQS